MSVIYKSNTGDLGVKTDVKNSASKTFQKMTLRSNEIIAEQKMGRGITPPLQPALSRVSMKPQMCKRLKNNLTVYSCYISLVSLPVQVCRGDRLQ